MNILKNAKVKALLLALVLSGAGYFSGGLDGAIDSFRASLCEK